MRFWFNHKIGDGCYIYKESDDLKDIYQKAWAEMMEASDDWELFNVDRLEIHDGLSFNIRLVMVGRCFLSPDLNDLIGEITVTRPGQDVVLQPVVKREFFIRPYDGLPGWDQIIEGVYNED